MSGEEKCSCKTTIRRDAHGIWRVHDTSCCGGSIETRGATWAEACDRVRRIYALRDGFHQPGRPSDSVYEVWRLRWEIGLLRGHLDAARATNPGTVQGVSGPTRSPNGGY